ncbi:MAG: HD family hydrolase [Yersinia sp. (in: enterobacteria)]
MTSITTYSGLEFDYSHPTIESICIEDITQALSHDCLFAGHLQAFYSVAQHSWLLSQFVPAEYAFDALLYDAYKAYCRDIPFPLKQMLPDYQNIERQIDIAIREKFGLPAEISEIVDFCNLIMLKTEHQELGIPDGKKWPMLEGIPVAEIAIHPMLPIQACTVFMARFNELTGGAVCQ